MASKYFQKSALKSYRKIVLFRKLHCRQRLKYICIFGFALWELKLSLLIFSLVIEYLEKVRAVHSQFLTVFVFVIEEVKCGAVC